MSRDAVLLRVVARLLPGPAVMVAVGLIVKGYVEVGDGFGAGMIVSLAVALVYITRGGATVEAALPVLRHAPRVAVGGLGLVSGFFPLALGQPPFSHQPPPGRSVIHVGALELFTPLAFDTGIFLLVVGLMTVLLHQLAPTRRSESGPDDATTPSGGPW